MVVVVVVVAVIAKDVNILVDVVADVAVAHLAPYRYRNASHEERLLSRLFKDYDSVARAVIDVSKPVHVVIDFVLLRIHGLVSITRHLP